MSMCSERYAEDVRLGFWKYQLPPTSSDTSKQVCGTPKSPSALQAVNPLTPAPITHPDGSPDMRESYDEAPGRRLCGCRVSPRASMATNCSIRRERVSARLAWPTRRISE